MSDTQLGKIKRRLGITDHLQDDLILDLVDDAQSFFKILTDTDEVNPKYDFIILNVAIKLYNRKGSEGMDSESVDGYSVSYNSELFAGYRDILERDFNLNDEHRKQGQVRFL